MRHMRRMQYLIHSDSICLYYYYDSISAQNSRLKIAHPCGIQGKRIIGRHQAGALTWVIDRISKKLLFLIADENQRDAP